ncbi:DUF916 domain-containing protein [Microbacterium sp. zg.Y625]|uniref:DUF916 domain-containing protein n=1 Tax=Microbacterium jiangjiandongii TaxID=3049071 RepID=UPI00214C023A|nr:MULTISPECIES: DUF916 domain-containing protein [unclassified Microbacterium]MCR2794102.1 DUF916 domain-containing protein [Microbacterium sp. zg.Y625]WIM25693.1 DUF916 domain-containing protein [Microbacterium sp. zg-Y625]
MNRFLPRIAIAALALALLSIPSAPAAYADDQPDGDVTWSMRPSDGAGEDGRAWIERELEPGESVVEHLLVRNLSASTVTFRLSAADGYFTETGRFNMLTADQESVGVGTWIELPDEVEVPSGGDAIVPFTITVPDDATPGDHPGGVASSIRTSSNGEFGIESRVGFRVMTRVTGELAPSLAVESTGTFTGSWNPFDPGRLDIGYTIDNTGNTRLAVAPQVAASALFGLVSFTVAGEPIAEMAPGESRSGTVRVSSVWPLFAYSTKVVASATGVSDELAAGETASASAASVVVAIPWAQLAAIALAALLIWLMWRDRRRRERLVSALIEQARQEGRESVSAGSARSSRRGAPVIVLVVLLAIALPVGGAPPASAADDADLRGPHGVVIHVEIARTPEVAPVAPVAPPAQVDRDVSLPRPNAPDFTALAGIGLAVMGVGAAAYVVSTRLRSPGRGSAP